MIYKFRIVSDEVDNFKREICIDSDASFLELHDAILDSVGFSKDQMTSFFICDDDWEKKTEITLMDMGKDSDEDTWIMASTKLSDLIEDEGQRLVFVFDYMTDRMFFMELKEIEPGKDLETPVCTRKEGNPPQQTMDFEELEKKNAANNSSDFDETFYGDETFDLPEAEEIDVRGKLLFPGFLDAHTHFDLEVCNTVTADDFYTGGRSALRGGTTTVIDFACPNKGETLGYGLDLWHKKADGRSSCDYSFHMTIDDWNEGIKNEIPAMFAAGIPSFKMYMTYPAMMIGDQDLFSALLELKKYGGIAGVHCENAGVIDALIAQHKAEGKTAPSSHPECRPNPLEAEAVAHLLRIAEVADVPIVIVHLSTKEALLEVMHARERGQKVYVETCPHYLLLDDSVYYQEDYSAAARYICAPPMRKKEDQEVLWKALANGTIQTVSTDHCSFTLQQKDAGRGDFTKIPGGLPGVETRGELLYTAGVAAGRITKEQMCALLSENPARLYGAYPRKGVIAPGSDADLVVYDPEADKTITAETQLSAAGYTPYEGWRTKGSIAQVYLRGTLAVDHGEMKTGPIGTYIPRHPGSL